MKNSRSLFTNNKNVDIKFSAHNVFLDNLHQLCSKLRNWKAII